MRTGLGARGPWLLAAVGMVAIGLPSAGPARADEPAGDQTRVEKTWHGTLTVIGTLISVDAESRTLVLDVPLAKGALRVGAIVPAKTEFLVGTRRLTLSHLRSGERMRLVLRRVPGGDEVVSGKALAREAEAQPRS